VGKTYTTFNKKKYSNLLWSWNVLCLTEWEKWRCCNSWRYLYMVCWKNHSLLLSF